MANGDQLRIEDAIDEALTADLSHTDRALILAWAQAWDRVSRDVEDAMVALAEEYPDGRIPPGVLRRDARLQAALSAVYAALDDMAVRAPALVATGLTSAVAAADRGNVTMIQAGLSGVLRAELRSSVQGADPGQIAAIIERSTQQITSRHRHLSDDAQAAIRIQMSRGIAVGSNPRRAASRAVRGIEDQWNGGLERARTIASTEILDAHRLAAQRVQEANADVLAGWEWLTHADERVCRSCISNHGRRFPLEEPGPLDHPRGRCARVPITKTWEELGFPGMREPQSRTPTRESLVESLSEAEQREMLGDDGYAAWKAGDYPISEWSRRKSVQGWRDSFVPSKPPKRT